MPMPCSRSALTGRWLRVIGAHAPGRICGASGTARVPVPVRSSRVWAASLLPLRARAASSNCRAPVSPDGRVRVVVVDWRREIGVVFFASAGESDVEVFAVDAGSGEQDRDVGGGALRGVDGGGPAVLDMLARRSRAAAWWSLVR